MPCYQVNLVSVAFHAENLDLLEAAVKALGGTFQTRGNRISMRIDGQSLELNTDYKEITGRESRGLNDTINRLKRGYSKQVVKTAAKRNRWTVRETTSRQFVATKY